MRPVFIVNIVWHCCSRIKTNSGRVKTDQFIYYSLRPIMIDPLSENDTHNRYTNFLKPVRDCCNMEHRMRAMRTSPAAPRTLTDIDAP